MTTPPTSGFQTDTSALDTHQQHLGAVMDQLAEALRVALGTTLPEEAFGSFGAPLAAAIKPTAEVAQAAFESAAESVGATREAMVGTVRDYDETEVANANMLRVGGETA